MTLFTDKELGIESEFPCAYHAPETGERIGVPMLFDNELRTGNFVLVTKKRCIRIVVPSIGFGSGVPWHYYRRRGRTSTYLCWLCRKNAMVRLTKVGDAVGLCDKHQNFWDSPVGKFKRLLTFGTGYFDKQKAVLTQPQREEHVWDDDFPF